MEPPPLPAALIAGGICWNFGRSLRNRVRAERGLPLKTTVSRWACRHKKIAVPIAVGGGTWVTVHWALYVVDVVDRS